MKGEKKYPIREERKIRIDVREISDASAVCDLYTGSHCAKITMSRVDYDALLCKGFFWKDDEELSSGKAIISTEEYYIRSWLMTD
jgi:hypothetical protein